MAFNSSASLAVEALVASEPRLAAHVEDFSLGMPLRVLEARVSGELGREAAQRLLAAIQGKAPTEEAEDNVNVFSCVQPPTEDQARDLVSGMPKLAGRQLEPPRFHCTAWHIGQVFNSAVDDPDRTSEPWTSPAFVKDCAPDEMQTEASDMEVRGCRSFARVVRGVLREQECAALIAHVNPKGFTPALLNIGMDQQRLQPHARDGHRVIVDSPELATWLLEVLRPHLPHELPDGSQLVELNERMRFLCYTPGQVFPEHTDAQFLRPLGHPRYGDRSRITVQLYLHDIPQENGGATRFFPSERNSCEHQPEAGSVLLFTQDMLHEGCRVHKGVKYTVRTEVMYSKSLARAKIEQDVEAETIPDKKPNEGGA